MAKGWLKTELWYGMTAHVANTLYRSSSTQNTNWLLGYVGIHNLLFHSQHFARYSKPQFLYCTGTNTETFPEETDINVGI